MDSSECCKEKLSQNLLPRQSKPFIDQNLQLQIPDGEAPRSLSPIYSHFRGDTSSASYLDSQVNEAELNKAMQEAKNSYEAWQKMKEQISAAAKSFQA